MPYSIDRKNKCVYKKKTDGSRGEKVGCTKGDLQKYIAALHASEKGQAMTEIRQALRESEKNMVEATIPLANTVKFYVVEKSKAPDDNPMDLVFEADPLSFANQIRGGLSPEDIYGFYLDEADALDAAHDQVEVVFETAKKLEEKKHAVTEKIQKKIQAIQKEIDSHLREAKKDPAHAEDHEAKAEALMSDIKELRAKHSLVEKSKAVLPERKKAEKEEKEDIKEELANRKKKVVKEDHEVSMAQGSLEAIIRHANQLLMKLGDREKDIPGWIQDHIAKAENYIQQASDQYHEYGPEHSKVLPEEKANKDYDKDGKIEKPEEEYKGVRAKAIQQAKGKQ